MQQIHRTRSMPKSDFNKVALHLYWNHNSTWIFFCNFYIEKLIRLHCTCQKFCAVLGELLEPCFGWLGEKQKSHFLLSNAIITLETWKCLRTLIHLHNFKKVFLSVPSVPEIQNFSKVPVYSQNEYCWSS